MHSTNPTARLSSHFQKVVYFKLESRIYGDPQLDGVVQDELFSYVLPGLMLRMRSHVERGKRPSRFPLWWAIRNLTLDFWRSRKLQKRNGVGCEVRLDAPLSNVGAEGEEGDGFDLVGGADASTDSDAKDVVAIFHRLVDRLPADLREVVRAAALGDYGWQADLARRDGVSRAAITQRFERGKIILGRLIQHESAAMQFLNEAGIVAASEGGKCIET